MNSVHEPGSRTISQKPDSGKIPSQIGPKTGSVHRVHNPWPARAPKRRLPAARSPPAAGAREPACACSPRACLPPALVPSAVSRHSCLSCNTGSPVSCHNTPGCIAIQPCLLQPFQPQYSRLYCDTISLQPSLLQYNLSLLLCNTTQCIAIQFFFSTIFFSALSLAIQLQDLQYKNFVFSQYNWAVAQKRFCTSNFFFFIYFQQLE